MLTDPMSPMGVSMFRFFLGCSEKYITQVNGYMYLNLAACLRIVPIRRVFLSQNNCFVSLIEVISGHLDKEIGAVCVLTSINFQIIQEGYEEDYSFYKKTVSLKPFMEIFNKLLKHLAWSMIKKLIWKPDAEKIQSICDAVFTSYQELVKQETEKMENDPNYSIHRAREVFQNTLFRLAPKCFPVLLITIITQTKVKKITKKYGIPEEEVEAMWGNRRENIANQMNHIMMRMAIILKSIITKDPKTADEVTMIIENKDNEAVRNFIATCHSSSDPEKQRLANEWDEFMKRFGRRGPGEVDIAVPRYEHRPAVVLAMIYNLDTNGYKDEDTGDREREAAIQRVLSKLSKRDRRKVEKMLPVTQCFLMYRESPKYLIITLFEFFRKLILRTGEKFQKQGLINSVEDVFFLKLEELCDYEEGKTAVFDQLVKKRREEDLSGRGKQFPRIIFGPECIMRTVSKTTLMEMENLPSNMLKGMPTSGGVIEGRAVVATDPDTTVLNKGDILVAKATDPGWTPLFVPAGGVVIEIGGPLTHGSVVAREMGIPCVVNVIDLTKKVKTGMRLRIDGNKGLIEIME